MRRSKKAELEEELLYKRLVIAEFLAEQTARQIEELSRAVDRLHDTVVRSFPTPQAS